MVPFPKRESRGDHGDTEAGRQRTLFGSHSRDAIDARVSDLALSHLEAIKL